MAIDFEFEWPGVSDEDKAYIAGMSAYAWWKDGEQYVGTCGTTLRTAIDRYLHEQGYVKQPSVKLSKDK